MNNLDLGTIKKSNLLYILACTLCFLLGAPPHAPGEENMVIQDAINQQDACSELLLRLEQNEQKISTELRQVKREVALLGQKLDKPGINDIFSGIGYILGLFGAVALVSSRKTKQQKA